MHQPDRLHKVNIKGEAFRFAVRLKIWPTTVRHFPYILYVVFTRIPLYMLYGLRHPNKKAPSILEAPNVSKIIIKVFHKDQMRLALRHVLLWLSL